MDAAGHPRTFEELIASPESRKAFTRAESRKIGLVLSPRAERRALRRALLPVLLLPLAAVLTWLALPEAAAALTAEQAGWWALILGVGAMVHLAHFFLFARHDFRALRDYLWRGPAIADSPSLVADLWTTKRFLWLFFVLAPMTGASLVGLIHSLGLLALPDAARMAWIGRAFVVPWTIAVALCLVSLSVLFESTLTAGILLKVHCLRTGERSIRLP